jgi:hypothetical protein
VSLWPIFPWQEGSGAVEVHWQISKDISPSGFKELEATVENEMSGIFCGSAAPPPSSQEKRHSRSLFLEFLCLSGLLYSTQESPLSTPKPLVRASLPLEHPHQSRRTEQGCIFLPFQTLTSRCLGSCSRLTLALPV